jgi:hypothetical protein
MKLKLVSTALFLIILCISTPAQENNQKSVSVTVYNDNLGVIKDERNINVKSGTSEIKISDVAKQIDPTSVHIKINGDVLEQNYQYDLVSLDKILEKYTDHNIKLIDDKDNVIQGKLLSSSGGQLVLQKDDGGLLMIPNTQKYRYSAGSLPEGLITKPTLVWTVKSKSSGNQNIEISYQTGGLSWHAEYVAVLNKDDNKLDLNSWVSIDNKSGATYKNATLKLVAGDINLVRNQRQNQYAPSQVMAMQKAVQPQFQEKPFFEYHIYNLQRPTTIADNETKQISLFEASDITAAKKYYYHSGNTYYGSFNPVQNDKVDVILEFNNSEKNNLGMPMPKGIVRVYKSDGNSLEFVGENQIDHTPKDENINLKIGEAFDILADEVQKENTKIADNVYEQSYEITLKNRKDEDVTVEVDRTLGNYWKILSSSLPYEKKDAQNIVFKAPVKKNSETKLTFKVRYSY